ncbi:MAG TPA: hypothetical protein VGV18_01955 [Verrucomicrobiae bacterium]|nr:hypothetical protein [Verrucomicrobiae bacterium]
MSAEHLDELQTSIELRCRCSAVHRQTVFVHEKTADNETVWFGDVEVYDLTGCKEATRCYAWESIENGVQVVTILRSRLVDSPQRAVQAALFSGIQSPMYVLANDPALLRKRIERAKRALHDAQINAEDLEAIMHTVQQTAASVSRKG